MLPLQDCPFKQQLGLGQARVDSLLRFIHVCCQKTSRESSKNHVLRGWRFGHIEGTGYDRFWPFIRRFLAQFECRLLGESRRSIAIRSDAVCQIRYRLSQFMALFSPWFTPKFVKSDTR